MNRSRHYAATFVAIMLTAGVAIAGGALGTSVGNSTGGGSSSGGIGCATPGGVLYSSTGSCEAAFSYDATTNTLSVDNLNISATFAGTDIEMLTGAIDVLQVLQIRGEGPSGTGFSADGPLNMSGYAISDVSEIGNTLGDITVTAALQFGGYSAYGLGNMYADYVVGSSVVSTTGAGVELTDNVNSYDHNRLYICTDTSNLTIWPSGDVDITNGGNVNITNGGGVFMSLGAAGFNVDNATSANLSGPVNLTNQVTMAATSSILVTTPTTVASFSTAQNNKDLSGYWSRVSTSVSLTAITGIASGDDGQHLRLSNVGSNTITISNQSASSTAANRVITGTGADYLLLADQTIDLIYDGTTARWRKVL